MLEQPLQVNYSSVQIPVLTNKNGLSKSSLDFPLVWSGLLLPPVRLFSNSVQHSVREGSVSKEPGLITTPMELGNYQQYHLCLQLCFAEILPSLQTWLMMHKGQREGSSRAATLKREPILLNIVCLGRALIITESWQHSLSQWVGSIVPYEQTGVPLP